MIKIDIIKTYFQTDDNKFDLDKSLMLSGKLAGVCYSKEGYDNLKDEDKEKTKRRINLTKNNGHHSVYDHIYMTLNIVNIPKILAMVINNEKEYTASEKSLRYTPVIASPDSIFSEKEVKLYAKWMEIYKDKIKKKYGDVYDDKKIEKLAQENSRAIVTVFMLTTLVYTVSLRQINYIVSYMKKYIDEHDSNDSFEAKLSKYMQEFIDAIEELGILDEGLLKNEKNRSLSLFGKNLDKKEVYYGEVYSTVYRVTFAELAQAQRHRTIDYKIELTSKKEYFIPPIIRDDKELVKEWLNDMDSVKDVTPIGELITVYERGTYENFILKCKERLCSAAQLEIMLQTKNTLNEYYNALVSKKSDLANDMKKYTYGARCTFPDFKCCEQCKFKEGINLSRKV